MDVAKNRRANVQRLLADRFKGVIHDFAEGISRSDAQAWQIVKSRTRQIGERVARDIERRLELPRLSLDADPASTDAPQPQRKEKATQASLALYSLHPDLQARVLGLFDRLTHSQQDHYLAEMEAAVRANEVIVREVGDKLRPVEDDHVENFLPPAPRPHRRVVEDKPATLKRTTHRAKKAGDE